MKKQFIIKAATSLKNVSQAVTKSESTNLLKFSLGGKKCCEDYMFITGRTSTNPVFSL